MALQNSSLEKLDLLHCNKLTGKPTVHVDRISKLLPQGSVYRNVPQNDKSSPTPQRSTGDMSALQNMALTYLALRGCNELTGTLPCRIYGDTWGKIRGDASGQHLNLLRTPHALSPLVPPGGGASFQNMKLTYLSLPFRHRSELGKPAVRVGWISKVLLQGNIKGRAPLNHVQPPDPFPRT